MIRAVKFTFFDLEMEKVLLFNCVFWYEMSALYVPGEGASVFYNLGKRSFFGGRILVTIERSLILFRSQGLYAGGVDMP